MFYFPPEKKTIPGLKERVKSLNTGVASDVIFYSSLVTAGMPFLLLIGATPNAMAYESKQFTAGEFFITGIPASIILNIIIFFNIFLIFNLQSQFFYKIFSVPGSYIIIRKSYIKLFCHNSESS